MDSIESSCNAPAYHPVQQLLAGDHRRARRLSRWHVRAAAEVADAAIICGTAVAGHALEQSAPSAAATVLVAVLTALLANRLLHSLGAYCFPDLRRARASMFKVAAGWLCSVSPIVILFRDGDLNTGVFSGWVFSWAISSLVLLVSNRLLLALLCRELIRRRVLGHAVCFIGTDHDVEAALAGLDVQAGIVPLGHFTLGRRQLFARSSVPWLGTLDDVVSYLRDHHVDQIIIAATDATASDEVRDLITRLKCLPVLISLAPNTLCRTKYETGPAQPAGDERLITIASAPLQGWRWILKDVQDRLLATLLFMLCLPCFLAIAAGIKLSSRGPVMFKQYREGYCGRSFLIYKFRTMHASPPSDGGLALTIRNDPRIFPFGALLRRTSLDELPQLLNVMQGDMWLVGPRPHSALATAAGVYYAKLVSGYEARHRMKPGITGWAQVNGWRGPTITREQIERRVQHDLYYVENWSPLLDLKILARTALHGFVHENAF